MNILQSYKQERGCLMHFAHLSNTLLKDEESARDNRKTIKARYQRSTKLQTNARQVKITCYT